MEDSVRADRIAVLVIMAGCVVGTAYGHFFVDGLGLTVEIVAATPGNALNTVAYALVCAFVYLWSIELYGHSAALGAVAVAAASPGLLTAAQYVPSDLVYAVSFVAVVYAQARNALDPSVQSVLIAATALGLALASGTPWQPVWGVSLAIVVVRVLAAEPGERRLRVAHGALSSIGLALALGAGLASIATVLIGPGGFAFGPWAPAAPPALSVTEEGVTSWSTGEGAAAPRDPMIHTIVDVRHLPLLLLAFVPVWPRHRRYSDGVLSVAIVLGGLLFGYRERADSTLLPIVPFVAILCGRAWDHHRSDSERHLATTILLVQVVSVLLSPLLFWR